MKNDIKKLWGIYCWCPSRNGRKDPYNTAFLISDDRETIGKHRKMFLSFNEPEISRPGKGQQRHSSAMARNRLRK